MKRILALAILALLPACASHDATSASVAQELNQRYSGHKSSEFFSAYGRATGWPKRIGDEKSYIWSAVRPPEAVAKGYATPPAASLEPDRICQLDIRTGRAGVIRSISVIRDSNGKMSNSYCGELFHLR